MKPEGKTIYSLIVSGDDITTPDEYRVVEAETESGIMVWGRWGNRWYPNPSTRYLIKTLLIQLNQA